MERIILYTKSQCRLCDEMKEIILRFKKEFDFDFEIINIENDKELLGEYKEKIPVLMINGKMFAKYKVDERRLRKKLYASLLIPTDSVQDSK